MTTTSDPNFGFAPSFEACPAQSIRRSSLKPNSTEGEGNRDYQVPIGGSNNSRPRRSSTSNGSSSHGSSSKKKHKSSSISGGERSSSSNDNSLLLVQQNMHQSGATALTDQTDKCDNSSSLTKKRRSNTGEQQQEPPQEPAAAAAITRPGVQHVSGKEHERSEQTRRVKQRRPAASRPGVQHVSGKEHEQSEQTRRGKQQRPPASRPGVQRVSGKEHEQSEQTRRGKQRRGSASSKQPVAAAATASAPSKQPAVSKQLAVSAAAAEASSRPGVQHVSGKEHERTEAARITKDPRMKHRGQKSAQDKIRAFNNKQDPSPVSVSDRLDDGGKSSIKKSSNGKFLAPVRDGGYIPPTNVMDNGYLSEKAKLFEMPPDEKQPENFMEQYTVVSRGSEDEEDGELFGNDVAKRFNDSFNLSQEFALHQGDEEKGGHAVSKGAAAHGNSKNGMPGVVVAAHGMAGAPAVEYGTTGGGFGGYGYDESFDDEGLAVAIAVDDSYYDGQSDYYHHAIEYNPDAKPSLLKNRRFRYYAIVVALFACLAGGAIGTVLLLVDSGSDTTETSPSAAPSDAPTTAAEGRYREQFISVVGSAVNEDGTAHDRAASWIMYEDRLRLTPIDDNLIQRYLLAYFYFATTSNEETAWKSCNRPKFNQESSCNHQKFLRNPADDTIFYEPEPATRWLSDTHECEWIGVQCGDGQIVIAVEIWGQDLTGPLPRELAYIEFLNSISLAYNDFTGTIPVEYAQMRHLINFEVHGNELSGTVPTDFWNALTLQTFNIAENDITGTLSTEIGRLTGLKGLHFSENQITGSLPSELGNLVYLSYMRADRNQLTGSIPTVLGKLGLLQELWLNENLLSGTIPTEVGVMDELIELRLDRNRIYGTIPEELWDNKVELTKLDLQDLLLSGTLSTKIGNLKNLESLRLRRNRLTGTVPTELAKIRSLRLAWLHLNEFTGSIPLQVCSRVGPGLLEFLNADCGPEGAPAQECACCHGCCDRQTELCQLTDFNPSS